MASEKAKICIEGCVCFYIGTLIADSVYILGWSVRITMAIILDNMAEHDHVLFEYQRSEFK